MTTPPWIRIVIVNYNGGHFLAQSIEGLARQTWTDFEAIIVDNGSTDGSLAACPLPDRRFTIVKAGANLGFAAGCNLGARGATSPWLAMLNPDAIPAPDWLARLHQAALRHPHARTLGSMQLQAENSSILDGAGDNYSIYGIAWRGGYGRPYAPPQDDYVVFAPCAAAAAYRRDAFESVGGFAEDFFCYLEDVDLGFRLRLAGFQAVQVVGAVVSHWGSAISGRHSLFTIFHASRNGIYLMIRCLPLPLLLLALPLHLAAQVWLTLRARNWQTARTRWKGVAAGLRALPALLRQRRQVQQDRRIGVLATARLLVWHPAKVFFRVTVPL